MDDSPRYLDVLERVLTESGIPVAQKILFWDEAIAMTTSEQMLSEDEVVGHEQSGRFMVVRHEDALAAAIRSSAQKADGVLCDYGLSERIRGSDIRHSLRSGGFSGRMVVQSATGTLPQWADGRYALVAGDRHDTLPEVTRKLSDYDTTEERGLKIAYLKQELGLDVPSLSVQQVAGAGPAKGDAGVKR